MQKDNDWYHVIDSVLFACRIATHCSTGVSPYRMMYNKDPILPFEYKDKLNYHPETCLNEECEPIGPNASNCKDGSPEFSYTLKKWKNRKMKYFLKLREN